MERIQSKTLAETVYNVKVSFIHGAAGVEAFCRILHGGTYPVRRDLKIDLTVNELNPKTIEKLI